MHHYGCARVAAMRAVDLAPGNAVLAARLVKANALLARFPSKPLGMHMPGVGFVPTMGLLGPVLGGHLSMVHCQDKGADWEASLHTGSGPCCDTCERDCGFVGTVPPLRDSVSLLRCSGCVVAMNCYGVEAAQGGVPRVTRCPRQGAHRTARNGGGRGGDRCGVCASLSCGR